ncbi:MAG: ABC transporter ATP-binding protein [Bacteroidota bacterium]
MLKNLIKKYFNNFSFFYSYFGYRMFVSIGLSIAVGVLDGFGIAMFLPLLQMVSDQGVSDPDSLGYMEFFVKAYDSIGVEMNLAVILFTMVIFFILKGIATYVKASYNVYLLELFSRKLRIQTLKGINGINFKTFVASDMGRIQNAMTGEVDRLVRAKLSYFSTIQQSVMVMVYAIFAFMTDYRFAILVILGGLTTNFFYQLVYKKTKKASRELSYQYDVYEGKIIQHVRNFKYIKATGLLNYFGERLRNTILDIQASRVRIGMLSAFMTATREPIMVVIVALVIFIQTTYLGGELGTILLSLLFFYRALTSVTLLQNSWNQYLTVFGSIANMKDFLKHLKDHKESNGQETIKSINKGIDLSNITFKYGNTVILKSLSLRIKHNESVAFVGESGSGKTTLVNILAALLPVNSGKYMIDGIPVENIDRGSYQQRIGYITQEPVVFNDTIFNNITLWAEKSEKSQRRFELAIEQASLSEFLSELENGQETELGHNGINMSGGQRQRLSIARELYKDIDILIMDEATSALDSETERSIQENIEALQGQYTLLIVAHRLSTIRNVDRVVFMDKGEIIVEGNFERLAETFPKFKKMIELQEL